MVNQDLIKEIGQIQLSLHNNLARYAGEKTSFFPMPIVEGETVLSLIEKLKIPRAEIGLIVVNGNAKKDLKTVLRPGDKVKIFGLVGGG